MNSCPCRQCYCSLSGRRREFVVTAAYPIQKWKYRILPQRLCENIMEHNEMKDGGTAASN
jgi:hypothetical protein